MYGKINKKHLTNNKTMLYIGMIKNETTNGDATMKARKIETGRYEMVKGETTYHIERTEEKNTWDVYATNSSDGNDHEWSERYDTKKQAIEDIEGR